MGTSDYKKYVQYIYMGNGFFNNTQEVESFKEEYIVNLISEIRNTNKGIKIFGYRCIKKYSDGTVKISSTTYITGEIMEYSKLNKEMTCFVDTIGLSFSKTDRVVVIIDSYPIIYKAEEGDRVIDYIKILNKTKEELIEKRKKELEEELEKTKLSLVDCLKTAIDCVMKENLEALNTLNVLNSPNKYIDNIKKLRAKIEGAEQGVDIMSNIDEFD